MQKQSKKTTLKRLLIFMVLTVIFILRTMSAEAKEVAGNQGSYWVEQDGTTYLEQVKNNTHYLFLPSSIKEDFIINYEENIVSVENGVLDTTKKTITVENKSADNIFEYTVKITKEDKTEISLVIEQSNLPCVSINLNGVVLSTITSGSKKTVYTGNKVTIHDPDEESYNTSFEEVELKGRGNSTWGYAKKPFQFKLSKKASVLGMGKAKKWLLIANYADTTLMKNALSVDLAREMGLPYIIQYRYVDLFVDGSYQGNYFLCEKVEVGTTRVNLKSDNGILVELDDVYGRNEDHYFVVNNQVYVLSDSRADDVDEADSKALKAFKDFENHIKELDTLIHEDNKDWSRISSMLDMESVVRIYFMQEYSVELDTCLTSFYMYKDGAEDVLHFGPVWDYDKAYNNQEAGLEPNKDYLVDLQKHFRDYGSDWYPQLCKIPEFNEMLNQYYAKEIKSVLETTSEKITVYKETITQSEKMNHIVWPKSYSNTSYSFDSDVNSLLDWTGKRLNYFAGKYQYTEPEDVTISEEIVAGVASQNKTITLPKIKENMNYGTIKFEKPINAATIENGILKYSTDDSVEEGKNYNITISVQDATGANYKDYAIIVTLKGTACTHIWGNYVNDNNATTEKNATETRTCSVCGKKETREIPNSKLPGNSGGTSGGDSTGSGSSGGTSGGDSTGSGNAGGTTGGNSQSSGNSSGTKEDTTTEAPLDLKEETKEEATATEKAENTISLNSGFSVSAGKNIEISWGRIKGADGYEVYVSYDGKKTSKEKKTIKSGDTKTITIKSLNGKAIDQKKTVKVYVVAYKVVDGKKVSIGKTITAYAVGKKNTSVTDVKDVSLSKKSYTLEEGKSASIKAKAVKRDENKKLLKNAKEFRYATTDSSVATVTRTGKIVAKGKGTCTVYVYAVNGCAKKVKVTVK